MSLYDALVGTISWSTAWQVFWAVLPVWLLGAVTGLLVSCVLHAVRRRQSWMSYLLYPWLAFPAAAAPQMAFGHHAPKRTPCAAGQPGLEACDASIPWFGAGQVGPLRSMQLPADLLPSFLFQMLPWCAFPTVRLLLPQGAVVPFHLPRHVQEVDASGVAVVLRPQL